MADREMAVLQSVRRMHAEARGRRDAARAEAEARMVELLGRTRSAPQPPNAEEDLGTGAVVQDPPTDGTPAEGGGEPTEPERWWTPERKDTTDKTPLEGGRCFSCFETVPRLLAWEGQKVCEDCWEFLQRGREG